MAISEHERRVIRELEHGLLSTPARSSTPRVSRRTVRLSGAVAGLAVGVLVIGLGLGLRDAAGTGLGVVGSIAFFVGACLAAQDLGPALRSRIEGRRLRDVPPAGETS